MLELLFDFCCCVCFEPPDEDDELVETEAPDEADTEVSTLLDFLSEMVDEEGQRGFSRHSSGESEEKSASMPLSVGNKKWSKGGPRVRLGIRVAAFKRL
jgi:hypothetical protein